MAEYTPSDDQIENAYIEFESAPTSGLTDDNLLTPEEAQARWTRWLAAHDARVRRDAWNEGWTAELDDNNPYDTEDQT